VKITSSYGGIQWNDDARMDITCPQCGAVSNIRFGDLTTANTKCEKCGVVFDGRGFKEEVERELKA
jgi:transcription initiation factor TFIIIB Brf1 subunit/transcription initiation factor TFIIB